MHHECKSDSARVLLYARSLSFSFVQIRHDPNDHPTVVILGDVPKTDDGGSTEVVREVLGEDVGGRCRLVVRKLSGVLLNAYTYIYTVYVYSLASRDFDNTLRHFLFCF